MIVRGDKAEFRYGYQIAVDVGEWKLTRDKVTRRWELDGAVKTQDSFWLTRGPLEFRAYVGSRQWKWQGVIPFLENGRVSATIHGEPER